MRLDKFLKVSRVIKRRTVAAEACARQRVSVNGQVAKSGKDLKAGDLVEVRFGAGTLKFRVLQTPETVRKEDAAAMYEMLEDTHHE